MHIIRNRWCIVHHLMVLYAPFQLVATIWPREQKNGRVSSVVPTPGYIFVLACYGYFSSMVLHAW